MDCTSGNKEKHKVQYWNYSTSLTFRERGNWGRWFLTYLQVPLHELPSQPAGNALQLMGLQSQWYEPKRRPSHEGIQRLDSEFPSVNLEKYQPKASVPKFPTSKSNKRLTLIVHTPKQGAQRNEHVHGSRALIGACKLSCLKKACRTIRISEFMLVNSIQHLFQVLGD